MLDDEKKLAARISELQEEKAALATIAARYQFALEAVDSLGQLGSVTSNSLRLIAKEALK